MNPKHPRRSRPLPPLLLTALLLTGCSGGPEVEVTAAERGPLRESFSEPARTRLARDHLITMPVDGRLGRIELEPGDRVEKGEALAPLDRLPLEQAAREARAAVAELEERVRLNEFDEIERSLHVELNATVEAARDALAATDKQVEAGAARARRTAKEHERMAHLAAQGNVSQQQLDDAALEAETALIGLREKELLRAAFNTLFTAVKLGPEYVEEWLVRKRIERDVIHHQLTQARARLVRAEHALGLARLPSPIDAVVLERYEQGGGPLPAGTPLLRLGSLETLEVVAEVLTRDALKLTPGDAVELEAGGGRYRAEVARIEPAGFTKLSSLGVEQQRVRVIVALAERPSRLGVGYRLQARFFTAERADTLTLPRFSVLQSAGGEHYVFKVVDGKLVRQVVETGLADERRIEITAGLDPGEPVVAAPDTEMREGERVVVNASR